MGTTHTIDEQGIAEVVMDNPPVNALTVAGWFDLADRLRSLGRDPQVRDVRDRGHRDPGGEQGQVAARGERVARLPVPRLPLPRAGERLQALEGGLGVDGLSRRRRGGQAGG